MLGKIRDYISSVAENAIVWKTKRKIIVIESDDWGSIRMPSKEIYKSCIQNNYRVDNNLYERYDSLASNEDVQYLFEVLSSYKDYGGRLPVITANVVMANPNFLKIERDQFENYHFEPFIQTLNSYSNHHKVWDYWLKGIESKMFFPQFHAREHLNVPLFMDELKHGNKDLHFAFKHRMAGIVTRGTDKPKNIYVKASDFRSHQDKVHVLNAFLEGLQLFEECFQRSSYSFIPTNYVWSTDFEAPLVQAGVKVIQGQRVQIDPVPDGKRRLVRRYTGKISPSGVLNTVRNVRFEPSLVTSREKEIDVCLKGIESAFFWNKPAIIGSHRVNYVGFIDENNREQNLKLLKKLIASILKKWPDVEFMNSEELGRLILKDV